MIAPEWEDQADVPSDAILFRGRRSTLGSPVCEARDWEHGMFLGATMSSQTTAAAAGAVGWLRFDPMAMLPFCGYHMADYSRHWLEIERRDGGKLPRILYLNSFRTDPDGKFLAPGHGENSRVLAGIFPRGDGDADAQETAIGHLPPSREGSIDTDGLGVITESTPKPVEIDIKGSRQQLPQMHKQYAEFAEKLPAELGNSRRSSCTSRATEPPDRPLRALAAAATTPSTPPQ